MKVPVSANDFTVPWIPDDQLLKGILCRIEGIDIDALARTPACIPECDLAKASHFTHQVWGIVGGKIIDPVIPVIGIPDKTVVGQLPFKEFFINGRNDGVHGCGFAIQR
jgi:hypothetical protein